MLVLFLTLVAVVAAGAKDPTIDGDPDGKQGWYSAPNYRSTLDIIWPCLLTVFLCCWTAIHPDIPPPSSTWQQRYLDRTACLFLGAVAPEIFVHFAFRERFMAKKDYESMVSVLGRESCSMTHAFYAGMGGFASPSPHDTDNKDLRYLLPDTIALCLLDGEIDTDSFITEDEIRDKGKADGLIKTLTLFQIFWLLVQSIARLIQHLPLSTLETSTLAYLPCAILIYYLWWNKPYEANIPTRINIAPRGTYTIKTTTGSSEMTPEASFKSETHYFLTIGVFIVVGAIHLAAWNSGFATPLERIAWRVCSLVIMVSMPALWIGNRVVIRTIQCQWTIKSHSWDDLDNKHGLLWLKRPWVGICTILPVLYGLARLYLVAEVFVGLRAAPKGIYKTPEWTDFIPHFG
ncbi:hypothetical protein CC86DRAFT_362044 [Ophiobolus disseminans]|uniref:Uncharacterized protein n=1 Tax=Ophiobolus disseminans TaxID=1469910 RepID=A0A6A6ZF75_9PLEO|nr:hypothetical protein CC86DRAFT_362044 [Ophiobolus disseminans]